MANLRALSRMAGIARGIRKGEEDYRTIQAVKQKTEQNNAAFDLDMKMKNLSLDKAEMENRLAPERILYEREKLKDANKLRKNQIKIAGLNIKEKEREITAKVQEAATQFKFMQDALSGELNLPQGTTMSGKFGGISTTVKGDEEYSDEARTYILERAAELKKKESGWFDKPKDDSFYMQQAKQEWDLNMSGNIVNDDDIFMDAPISQAAPVAQEQVSAAPSNDLVNQRSIPNSSFFNSVDIPQGFEARQPSVFLQKMGVGEVYSEPKRPHPSWIQKRGI